VKGLHLAADFRSFTLLMHLSDAFVLLCCGVLQGGGEEGDAAGSSGDNDEEDDDDDEEDDKGNDTGAFRALKHISATS
jgi:hypothetical protein